MEKALSNSVNMIRNTLTYCTNNPGPTSGILPFATAKASAATKLILIDGLNQIAQLGSKNVTLDTNIIRGAMCDIAFKVGSGVSAYAASVNNNTLRGKVTFTRLAFNRFKKEDVDDICETIQQEGDSNVLVAGPFGYDATDVSDLLIAITLYRTNAQNPRQAIISKGQAVTQMKSISGDIIKNIFEKQMDKMVDTLLLSEPNFHKGYRLSRETINLGVIHAKIRGSVRDSVTAPLSGVLLVIRSSVTGQIIAQTLTKADGSFSVSPVPVGDYDFYWSLEGYQTVSETNVHIAAGKVIRRKITMLLNSQATTILEADVPASTILNIDLSSIHASETSTITILVSNDKLRFYKAANTTDPPGLVYFDKEPGSVTMTLVQFVTLLGFNPDTDLLNVKNIGSATAHYKITITNL